MKLSVCVRVGPAGAAAVAGVAAVCLLRWLRHWLHPSRRLRGFMRHRAPKVARVSSTARAVQQGDGVGRRGGGERQVGCWGVQLAPLRVQQDWV